MPLGCPYGLIDPTDSPATVIRKRYSFGLNAGAVLICAASFLHDRPNDVSMVYILPCITAFLCLTGLFVTRRVSPTVLSWNIICFVPPLLLVDWVRVQQLAARTWPAIVLLLDINLVTGGETWVDFSVLGLTVLSLVVVCCEQSFRFGMFEVASHFGGSVVGACDCEDPPCFPDGPSAPFAILVGSCAILSMDYYFTRRFAKSMFAANTSMEKSIDTAQSIARALAGFDLEAASSRLDNSTLPDGLRDAFGQILQNLTSYKPYLPEAIWINLPKKCDGRGSNPGLPA
ncbi:hypothetical protein DIPPA_13243 [Diplonema papillatum]|nr:hypothetical protein DIPPA_13243 [Diplonema papillatum]